jgi:cobalt-zinc-cadmium efflux system protein
VTSGFPALSAHVVARAGLDLRALRLELEGVLRERFDLRHTTLQLDHEQAPLRIEPAAGDGQAGDGSSPSARQVPEK